MRMIIIKTDKGGINVNAAGVDAISPSHLLLLYVVEGKRSVVGCMVYAVLAWLVGL
jgi:hypothetical protein